MKINNNSRAVNEKQSNLRINKNSLNYASVLVDDRPNKFMRFTVLNTLLMTRLLMPLRIYTSKKSLSKTKKLQTIFYQIMKMKKG